MKKSKPEYLAKALQLSEEDKERLLSRMGGKLPKRIDKNKLSVEEALAVQLELEDEQLEEWRNRLTQMRAKDEAKASKKGKEVADPKSAEAATSKAKPAKKS